MKSYNVKCLGCGQYLNDDINSTGYVQNFIENKTVYCKRCFNLKHYGKTTETFANTDQIEQTLKELNLDNTYVFLILDLLNIPNSLIDFNTIKNAKQVYIVINKIDCFPKKFNFEVTENKIKNILEENNYKNYELVYTSINNKSSIKRLNGIIKKIPINNKIYFVGKTNTGKSSLINELLKLNQEKPILSSSPFINTTINFKKINLNKRQIIDTPGFVDKSNLLNYINSVDTKKIINSKGIDIKNYYLQKEQSINIEKIASVNLIDCIQKTNLTIYINKGIKLLRCKTINSSNNLINPNVKGIVYKNNKPELVTIEFNLNPQKKYNLHLNGLAMISISPNATKISVTILKDVQVKLNEYAII